MATPVAPSPMGAPGSSADAIESAARAAVAAAVLPLGGSEDVTIRPMALKPPMLLEHTHVDPGSIMRWELEPVDAGCVLRLSHFVTDVPAAVENGYVVGLHTSLSRLAPCLAGEPVPWDWDEFAETQARYADLGLAVSAS